MRKTVVGANKGERGKGGRKGGPEAGREEEPVRGRQGRGIGLKGQGLRMGVGEGCFRRVGS